MNYSLWIYLLVSQPTKFSFCRSEHRATILAFWMQLKSWLWQLAHGDSAISALGENSESGTFPPPHIPENNFLGIRTFSHCWAQQVSVEICLEVLGKDESIIVEKAHCFCCWHPHSSEPNGALFGEALCFSYAGKLFLEAAFFSHNDLSVKGYQ